MQIKDADLCTFTHFSTSMQGREGRFFDEEIGVSDFKLAANLKRVQLRNLTCSSIDTCTDYVYVYIHSLSFTIYSLH